jgi:hypothetical protein
MDSKVLLKSRIVWKKHPQSNRYFYIENEGVIIFLRINNFPEEPFYTLINEMDIIDIEDKPKQWFLECS